MKCSRVNPVVVAVVAAVAVVVVVVVAVYVVMIVIVVAVLVVVEVVVAVVVVGGGGRVVVYGSLVCSPFRAASPSTFSERRSVALAVVWRRQYTPSFINSSTSTCGR